MQSGGIDKCTQSELMKILNVFAENIRKEIGNKLFEVILFGSYTHGDFDEESDFDIELLIDVPQGYELIYYKQLTKIICDIDEQFDYAVLLPPVIISSNVYEE